MDEDHIFDICDIDHGIGHGSIQHHRVDTVHDAILLHIHAEPQVHKALKELPQDADGHGETKCYQCQEQR